MRDDSREAAPRTDSTAAVVSIAIAVAALGGFWVIGRALPDFTRLGPAAPAIFIVALALGAVALVRPRVVFYSFLFGCMVIPFVFEETSLSIGFMKVYIQDVVFAFNVVVITVRWSLRRVTFWRISFNRFVLLHLAIGIYGLAVGFGLKGNAFDYSFGDFRRAFFYLLNYFVALYLVQDFADVRNLLRVLNWGGFAIIAHGAIQILTGQFYYRRFGDAAHILSHYELTFLSFVIFYALAQFVFNPQASRVRWGAVLAAGVVLTIVGNYRAAWLSLVGGVMFFFLYLPTRKKFMLVQLSFASVIAVSLVMMLMWEVQIEGETTLGKQITTKADVRRTTQDVNVIWRFQSYANALQQWQKSPWIGTGLGEELEFVAVTSTGGSMLTFGHRVHNSFIWFLMSLGVVGFSGFLWVQYKYVRTLLQYLKTTSWSEGRVIIMEPNRKE